MVILGSRWTPGVNMLAIGCSCGRQFWHRSDRWKVVCPGCSQTIDLGELRRQYRELNEKKP